MKNVLTALCLLLLPSLALAQTVSLTPVCTVNADGVTKTCIAEMPYDGTSKYAVSGSATNPTTGDSASFTAVVVPLCGNVEILRPSGKLQIKWNNCNKDLNVSPYTLIKQTSSLEDPMRTIAVNTPAIVTPEELRRLLEQPALLPAKPDRLGYVLEGLKP